MGNWPLKAIGYDMGNWPLKAIGYYEKRAIGNNAEPGAHH